MPTYLIHGFRWARQNIRIHIIINDLEDGAPDWIIAPATSATLLNSFYTLFDFLPASGVPPREYGKGEMGGLGMESVRVRGEEGRGMEKKGGRMGKASIGSLREMVGRKGSVSAHTNTRKEREGEGGNIANSKSTPSSHTRAPSSKTLPKPPKPTTFNDWSAVKLLEQHDADDLETISQPYAYVGDYMVEIPCGVDVLEEMGRYERVRRDEEEAVGGNGGTGSGSVPSTPGTSGSNTSGDGKGEAPTPPLGAREIRRRSRRLGWIEKLRDSLEAEAKIGWFVVVCGDEERKAPSIFQESEDEEGPEVPPKSAGLMGFWGKRKPVPSQE